MKRIKVGHYEYSEPAFQNGEDLPQLFKKLRTMVGLKVLSLSKFNFS